MNLIFLFLVMTAAATLPKDHPCADPRTLERMGEEWFKLQTYKEFMVFQQHVCFSLFMDMHLSRQHRSVCENFP